MTQTLSCRICLEETGILIRPCACKGTAGNVHRECLEKWVEQSQTNVCEICKTEYAREEVYGCNLTNYVFGIFSFRPHSELEAYLIRTTAFHMIFAILFFSLSALEDWLFAFSIITLTYMLLLIGMQIYAYDVEFFVLNVCLYWGLAYLMSVLLVGVIKSMDNEEMCNFQCERLSRKLCIEECIVYEHYQSKEVIVHQTLAAAMIHFCSLFIMKIISTCFTHMKSIQYQNKKADRGSIKLEGGEGEEESVGLLEVEPSSV